MKTYKTIVKALLKEGYALSVREAEDFSVLISKSTDYKKIVEEVGSVEGAYIIVWRVERKEDKKFYFDTNDQMLVYPYETITDDFEDINDYNCEGIIEKLIDTLSPHYCFEGVQ